MSLLAAIDFEAVAKIVIFAAIAIAAIVQRLLKEKTAKRTEIPRPDVDARAPRRHEEPVRHAPAPAPRSEHRGEHGPPTLPRHKPTPEPTTSHRAPGALGGLRAPSASQPRARLTDFETARLQFSGEQPAHTAAALAQRTTKLNGRALLFGRDLSPHDRVRSAFLWHEVLDLPPSLSETG